MSTPLDLSISDLRTLRMSLAREVSHHDREQDRWAAMVSSASTPEENRQRAKTAGEHRAAAGRARALCERVHARIVELADAAQAV